MSSKDEVALGVRGEVLKEIERWDTERTPKRIKFKISDERDEKGMYTVVRIEEPLILASGKRGKEKREKVTSHLRRVRF